MKGKTKGDAGGKTPGGPKPAKISGNADVFKEVGMKRGGKAMHGAKAKHRLDKPGRKMGGRCGADKSPLSSAHKSA